MVEQRHVTVVGAGIVGVACASWLQRAGFGVTLIDRLPPGEGCSFGNSGMISPDAVVPYSMPGAWRDIPKWLLDPLGPLAVRWTYLPKALPWLIGWLRAGSEKRAMEISRALRALHGQCFEAYDPLVKAAGAQDLLRRNGALYVSEREGVVEGSALAARMRELAGARTELLDADALRQLEPCLAPIYKWALFFPDNGQSTNSFRLVQVLAEQVVRSGGELLRDTVTGFEIGPNGPRRALLESGGRRPLDHLVIAAGAWSHRLTAQLGTRVPLEAERGYHVMLPDPGVMPRMVISNRDRSFGICPMENGLRFAGTVEIAGVDAPANWRRAQILLEHGKRMFPGLNTAGATQWMGCRPALPDELPVLDRSPRFRNVYFAFGNAHFGLTAASMMGKLTAELVAGAPPSIDISPFRVTRFRGARPKS